MEGESEFQKVTKVVASKIFPFDEMHELKEQHNRANRRNNSARVEELSEMILMESTKNPAEKKIG